MKNNYPIKYALVPIIKQIGWSHGLHDLERKYGIVFYIASKCYLVKKTKDYNIKGNIEKKISCGLSILYR